MIELLLVAQFALVQVPAPCVLIPGDTLVCPTHVLAPQLQSRRLDPLNQQSGIGPPCVRISGDTLACPEGANLLAPPIDDVTQPAVSVQPTDRWWADAAIFMSATAALADATTTAYAKGKWGPTFREANLVMRPFAGDPVTLAIAKAATDGTVTYLMVKHHKRHRRLVVTAAVAKTLLSAWVAHRNAVQLGLRD